MLIGMHRDDIRRQPDHRTAGPLRGAQMIVQRRFGCMALLVALSGAVPALAQTNGEAVSQAVVQPLPPAGVAELNSALRRLARNSRNVGALVDAGNASLKVGDVDAAIGFFGRAEELFPGNSAIKIGLAAAFTRKQRPLDALRLFDEAERAGASTDGLASDRGLAYDLVGDNVSAQRHYQTALSGAENAGTRQRLALSHAMAGDREGFERILGPLVAQGDASAYRTRAFGLAILGEDAEAVAIAEAVMPRNLSARIAPYLRYMPRLTKAQQAAAANLGVFPRAAQIGRDNPNIAQYANSPQGRNADARLVPSGTPLGRPEDSSSPRRRPDRSRSAVTEPSPAVEVVQPEQSPALAERVAAQSVSGPPPSAPPPSAPPPSVPAPAATAPAKVAVTAVDPVVTKAVADKASPPPPGFDLAAVSSAAPVVGTSENAPESVAEAFANFSLTPETGVAPSSGGVDIRTIEPPREIEKKPEPVPEKPTHPKRFWVQVATGRNTSALRFDWRRISRKSGDILEKYDGFTTPWGQSNRLLAGPFGTSRAAQRAVTALKKEGVDSFTFTSPKGQEIIPLK